MNIKYSLYQLHPAQGSQSIVRQGALLKVAFPDIGIGYADCHPWPELGNFPLQVHLKLLSEGRNTSLTAQSLAFARLDAQARGAKQHLFSGLVVPDSHHLIADISTCKEIDSLEGKRFKIKVGRDLPGEVRFLHQWEHKRLDKAAKLILDFNSRITEEHFRWFLKEIPELLDHIECFEDPFPYQPMKWQQIREEFRIALACDMESMEGLNHPHSCDLLVIKPALEKIEPYLLHLCGRSLVITSCLDHPIGQLSAAYEAALFSKENNKLLRSCGLLSHHAYESTPFSVRLAQKSSRLIPSMDGYGWGYDDLLEELTWQSLV